jgi:RNA polymerase II subunit A small phosphatase-like protein
MSFTTGDLNVFVTESIIFQLKIHGGTLRPTLAMTSEESVPDPFRDDSDPTTGEPHKTGHLEVKIGHHESLTHFPNVVTSRPANAFSMETFAAPPSHTEPVSARSGCCSKAPVDSAEPETPAAISASPSADLPAVLLPPPSPEDALKICLVLDLDETLIHSGFSAAPDADLTFSFGPEEAPATVCVRVRPGARTFLEVLAPVYERVVFTASVKPYADRVVDHIDPHGFVRHRLYRDSCTEFGGSWVKDLSRLNRRLERIIIVDNSPGAYLLHPYNAIPIPSWFDDPSDTALVQLLFFLRHSYRIRNIYDLLGSE